MLITHRSVRSLGQLVDSLKHDVLRPESVGGHGRLGVGDDVAQVDTREQTRRQSGSTPVEAEPLLDNVLLPSPVCKVRKTEAISVRLGRRKVWRNEEGREDSLPAQTSVTGRVTTSNLLLRSASDRLNVFLTSLITTRKTRNLVSIGR